MILIMTLTTPSITKKDIKLSNPSFESQSKENNYPANWDVCGKYSTPDMQPGIWGVSKEAAHGSRFLGLTVRTDNTWEYLGQPLSEPLEAKGCYKFSMSLAKAMAYSGYSKPVKVRIWGGMDKCTKNQLLGETEAIQHTEWKKYDFIFAPNKKVKYLTIEAYFVGSEPYKGNVLIDNCSSLEICSRA